jgi:hypothetical protein
MMSSTVLVTSCLVAMPRHAQSTTWRRAVRSLNIVAEPGEWSTGPAPHCSRMSTRLVDINCAAYPHVLQAYDGSDVRRLGNIHACIRNMCA